MHLALYSKSLGFLLRMGGRAVEGTGLENRQAGDRLVGSNPTVSATISLLSLLPVFLAIFLRNLRGLQQRCVTDA